MVKTGRRQAFRQKEPVQKSKGTTNQIIDRKGTSTAGSVLAEIGHSRFQNRPLKHSAAQAEYARLAALA
jgi:hypothetical protein